MNKKLLFFQLIVALVVLVWASSRVFKWFLVPDLLYRVNDDFLLFISDFILLISSCFLLIGSIISLIKDRSNKLSTIGWVLVVFGLFVFCVGIFALAFHAGLGGML